MSRKVWIETVLVVAIVTGLYIYLSAGSVGAESAVVIPAAAVDNPKVAGPLQTAVLAGGCFWGVQGCLSTCSRRARSVVWIFRWKQGYRRI